MSEIRWEIDVGHACGYVEDYEDHLYVVGTFNNRKQMVADVRQDPDKDWMDIDAPVDSVEHGIQLCEMWHATGAYR